MKKLIFITLLVLLSCFFYLLDGVCIKNRVNDIHNNIDLFVIKNNFIPKRLDEVSDIFKSSTPNNPESYCEFFDSKIKGYGYCFYSSKNKEYIVLIRGFFRSVTYDSKNRKIVNDSGLN